MLNKSTFDFLKSLRKNNNREWFEKNRDKYEKALEDFKDLTGRMIKELGKIYPALGVLKQQDCIFRIYRDVRFSKNKDPYKTNMGAYFADGGKKSIMAGYYLQIEPGNCFIAGGCWMPQAPQLKAIRQEIDYNYDEFRKIVTSRKFKTLFGDLSDTRLKTNPKGYAPDNPAITYLRQTSFIVTMAIKDDEFINGKGEKMVIDAFRSMKPFLDFLNRAIS